MTDIYLTVSLSTHNGDDTSQIYLKKPHNIGLISVTDFDNYVYLGSVSSPLCV